MATPNLRNTLANHLHQLLGALLSSPKPYQELFDVITMDNPTEYIRKVRNHFGLDASLQWVEFTTIDGQKSRYGEYTLTDRDREKVAEILGV